MSIARRVPQAMLLLVLGCGAPPTGSQWDPSPLALTTNVPATTQIVPTDRLAGYRAALPRVSYRRLQNIFDSPTTLWFDKQAMIPSYQDSVGDGSVTPIGARPNAGGRRIIVPEGRRLFDANGEHWAFPFGVTAGTDRIPNRFVLNFLSLPDDGASLRPVVYRTVDDNSAIGGLGLHKWTWMFPKGTTAGEIMFLEAPNGDIVPAEVRIRTRYLTGWAVNIYRPFPTSDRLASAIKQARPSWMSQPALQTLVAHLEDLSTLSPRTLESPGFNNIVTLSGFVDTIPDIADAALVRELLTTTPFVSCYGLAWKNDGGDAAYAATTREAFSVVPADYDGALLEVREHSCIRCHQEAGRSINDFEPAAVLYGDIWGEDRIFSFHPWDQDRFSTFNTENREVRPEFASDGLVVRFNPADHGADAYAWIE